MRFAESHDEACRYCGSTRIVVWPPSSAGRCAGCSDEVRAHEARLDRLAERKLGLARAMLKRPDALILAEAGNALDGASQAKVIQNVLKEFKGRGVVWGLSRARFASQFDHVLVMRAGRVVEQGAFEQLNRPDTALKELLSAE